MMSGNKLVLILTNFDLINIHNILLLDKNISILLDSKIIKEKYIDKIKLLFNNRNIFYYGYEKIENNIDFSKYTLLKPEYKFYSKYKKINYIKISNYYIFQLSENIIFYSYDYVFNNNKILQKNWNKYYKKNLGINILWGQIEPDYHIKNFYKNFLYDKNNLDILDVGCGAGKNSFFLFEKGFNLTGIDISNEAINFCKGKNEKILFKNINILDLKCKKYDVIIDGGCLHVNHYENQKKILKKYYDIINNNGIIFIRFFNIKNDKENISQITTIDNMPIYGINKNYIEQYFGEYFNILNCEFDSKYGDNGCFYIVLNKK